MSAHSGIIRSRRRRAGARRCRCIRSATARFMRTSAMRNSPARGDHARRCSRSKRSPASFAGWRTSRRTFTRRHARQGGEQGRRGILPANPGSSRPARSPRQPPARWFASPPRMPKRLNGLPASAVSASSSPLAKNTVSASRRGWLEKRRFRSTGKPLPRSAAGGADWHKRAPQWRPFVVEGASTQSSTCSASTVRPASPTSAKPPRTSMLSGAAPAVR